MKLQLEDSDATLRIPMHRFACIVLRLSGAQYKKVQDGLIEGKFVTLHNQPYKILNIMTIRKIVEVCIRPVTSTETKSDPNQIPLFSDDEIQDIVALNSRDNMKEEATTDE